VKKREQWAATLNALRASVNQDRCSAHQAVSRMLTLDGRVPYRLARESLTATELAICDQITGRDDILIRPESDESCSSSSGVAVSLTPFGKTSLYCLAFERPSAEEEIIFRFQLAQHDFDILHDSVASHDALERDARRELDNYLEAWEIAGELSDRIDRMLRWIDRVDGVLIYVDRKIYSRTDIGTSTLRSQAFIDLAAKPVRQWAEEDRLLVVGLHLLFSTGRSFRFEEFNGRQMSAIGLRMWLLERRASYRRAIGTVTNEVSPFGRDDVFDLAEEVRRLTPKVDSSRVVRIRRISGPFFTKNEVLYALPATERAFGAPPPLVADFCSNIIGVDAAVVPHIDLVLKAAEFGGREAISGGSASILTELLERIVYSAVTECAADYGMTSAVRSLASLDLARAGSNEAIVMLEKKDFFCCVLPRLTSLGEFEGEKLSSLLWQVAQRMQYNRWHFVPGNFADIEVPSGRHYFYPPLLPDIAVNSDLRHGGHVAARVRYSIRAPGPAAWESAMCIGANEYRGCYDIRVARMGGEPFSLADLGRAIKHSALIGSMWRGVASAMAARSEGTVTVDTYDAEWYRSAQWVRTVERFRMYTSTRQQLAATHD
jgi:hypothetical protein